MYRSNGVNNVSANTSLLPFYIPAYFSYLAFCIIPTAKKAHEAAHIKSKREEEYRTKKSYGFYHLTD